MNKFLSGFFISLMMYAPAAKATDYPIANLQKFIEKIEAQNSELQGGAIVILYKGQVIYENVFGYRKDKAGPITSSTLFPIASVSKTVSTAAISLLVDNGKLSFDKKFKVNCLKNQVNLANVLGHTTGYYLRGDTQIEQGLSRQKILAKLQLQKPQCIPGKCYFYSNIIFGLVEEALATSHLSLQQVMENLRKTLKTNEIQIMPINSNFKIAYPHQKGKALPFPPFYPKAASASAGVFASINGMIEIYKLSFGYRSDLISQKTLDYIHAPRLANDDIKRWNKNGELDGIDSYYGIGWRILKNKKYPNDDLIFHSGYIAGVTSFIGFIPSKDIGMIILYNQFPSPALKNGLSFWKEVIEHKTSLSPQSTDR